jgi:ubiquinone/menaquinone biosynthesis C-methylase UbiE
VTERTLLDEQIAYYRARAWEYDHWWERSHQYELPPDVERQWRTEQDQVERLVGEWVGAPQRVLEIASGTGIWTRWLARRAASVVAVDAAPETIAVAKEKVTADGTADRVSFLTQDVFAWTPPKHAFDVVFFSFWISHVPPDALDRFWSLVRSALAPEGRAVIIDNRWSDGVWPQAGERPTDHVQLRTDLSSGDSFRIVKCYYEPDELEQMLRERGWRNVSMTATDRFFVAGFATP